MRTWAWPKEIVHNLLKVGPELDRDHRTDIAEYSWEGVLYYGIVGFRLEGGAAC